MKNLMIALLNVSLFCVVACSNNSDKQENKDESAVVFKKDPKTSCYIRKNLGELDEQYTITFEKAIKLLPVKSNENYYAQFQAGRDFGCVLFAVKYTEGELKGTFKARDAQHLVSTCEGKQDYIYTQFENADGKGTFRLQCEKAVYEDQLPKAFAPTFDDVQKIDFDKKGKGTTKVCTVVESGSGESSVCVVSNNN